MGAGEPKSPGAWFSGKTLTMRTQSGEGRLTDMRSDIP
jgi:hypothetical protein